MGIFDMKCGTCERSFTTVAARKQHERDKHGVGVAAVVDDDEEIEEAEIVEVFEARPTTVSGGAGASSVCAC